MKAGKTGNRRSEAIDLDKAIMNRANRNPYHELLLAAVARWEAANAGPPAAMQMHPFTLETLAQEPKAREWNQSDAGPKRFYGIPVLVRAYEGVPYQLLSADEARDLQGL